MSGFAPVSIDTAVERERRTAGDQGAVAPCEDVLQAAAEDV